MIETLSYPGPTMRWVVTRDFPKGLVAVGLTDGLYALLQLRDIIGYNKRPAEVKGEFQLEFTYSPWNYVVTEFADGAANQTPAV